MKCKHCGGELLFRNGSYLCDSCGATFAIDSIYENIDVCICYEENDTAGRRTKDSVIAQEVYRKLEESKVATFYERISADGMIGNDLEMGKLAAIHKAKAIIVLGTSVENFTAIETKYSEHFSGKPVIPFCVDVNPGAIPKTLSKIQAISYSTIGWDKDLIKGVYNILGREETVDIGSLYGRKKGKVVIGIITAVAVSIAVWLLSKPGATANNADTGTKAGAEQMAATETRPLTPKEIYEQAEQLVAEGSYIEALQLLNQIPDYKETPFLTQRIYSQYEGYYQNETITLRVAFDESGTVTTETKMFVDGKVRKASSSNEIVIDTAVFHYMDDKNISGTLELVLENTGLRLKLTEDSGTSQEATFALSSRTDEPSVVISADVLLSWIKEKKPIEEIEEMGYEIELIGEMDRAGANQLIRIQDTDIYISLFSYVPEWDVYGDKSDGYVYGISAPAELIAPFLIGSEAEDYTEGAWEYQAHCFLYADGDIGFTPLDWFVTYDATAKTISANTQIGVALSKYARGEEAQSLETNNSDAKETPYRIKIRAEVYNIHAQPSYDSPIEQVIPIGTYTIVEEKVDAEGRTWGKLKSGVGWICVSDISSDK